MTALIQASTATPYTIWGVMTAEELGQPSEGKLFRVVHDYWMSARRRDQPVPVEVECCMPPDPLISRIILRQGKSKHRQTELDTPSSSSRSPSPVQEEEIELWTLTLQQGTQRVPRVVCETDSLQFTPSPAEIALEEGVFTLGRDRVMLDMDD
eukprot:407242-Rhodomonas_salina.1